MCKLSLVRKNEVVFIQGGKVLEHRKRVNKLKGNEIATFEEIKKAMECRSPYRCLECDLEICRAKLLPEYIVDLISRKIAEIENLNIELQAIKAEVERYEKTVGTLATKKDGTVIATLNGNKTEYIPRKLHKIFKNMAVNRAKSEAIKEFAEKLKEYYPSIADGIDYTAEEVLKD